MFKGGLNLNFDERINHLHSSMAKDNFDFRFEALFEQEEWIQMSLNHRNQLEREFRRYVEQHDHLRIPYASQDHIRMRMYNSVYDFNSVKHNFKAYI